MSLKLNCLLTDTNLREDIKDYINDVVSLKIGDNESAVIAPLYEQIRSEGIEIDAESFAHIYNELYSGKNDSRLSDADAVIKFAGLDFKAVTKKIGNAEKGEPNEDKAKKIGRLSPVQQAVKSVMSLFDQANYPQDTETKSVMKNISDTLNKLVNSKVEKVKGAKEDIYDSISNFFGLEEIENYPKKNGGFNNIETAFNDLKNELNQVVSKIVIDEKLDATQEQILREKYDTYVNELQNATYDIILSKGEQAELLRNLLNQNGLQIDGKGVKNFNNNINWDKLAGEFGEPKLISAKVKEILMNGVTNNDGNIVKYEEPYAQRIADYFERLYEAKRDEVIQAKSNAITDKNTVASILSNFVKSKGFITLGKDQDGNLKRVISNWDKIVKSIKNNITSIDDLKAELKSVLELNYKLDKGQIELVLHKLEETILQKMQGRSRSAIAIDKIIALSELNGGTSFNRHTASALMDILGIDDLSQENINLIQQGTEAASDINKNTPFSPINGTAIQLIQRNAKQIVINEIKRNSPLQRTIRVFTGYVNAVMQSILQNGYNFIQNVTSGVTTNINQSGVLLAKGGKQALPILWKSQKAFWNGFVSQIAGGVEQATQNDSVLGSELMTGEQYRVREWMNLFSNGGFAGVLEGVATTPVVVVNTLSRILLNSFDAGLMASQLSKGVLIETYSLLETQGYSRSEINDVIASYNSALANIDYKKQISDAVNSQVQQLKRAGVRVNFGDKMLMKRNLEFALIGDSLIGEGSIDKANVKDTVKMMFDNAITMAMILHGKRQIPSGSFVSYLGSGIPYAMANTSTYLQTKAFEGAEKSKKNGDYNKSALQYTAGTILASTIGAFANGIANFFVLALTNSPLGFIHYAGLYRSKRNLESEHPELLKQNVNIVDQDIQQKYMLYKAAQSAILGRALVGTGLVLSLIAADAGDDDPDKGWYDEMIANLMQTKTGRKILAYVLPMYQSLYETVKYKGNDQSAKNKKYDLGKEIGRWAGYNIVGARDGGLSQFLKQLDYAKENELDISTKKSLMQQIPSAGVNYIDKYNQITTTLKSATTGDPSDVLENENTTKELYINEYENFFDEYTKIGGYNTIKNIKEDSKYK